MLCTVVGKLFLTSETSGLWSYNRAEQKAVGVFRAVNEITLALWFQVGLWFQTRWDVANSVFSVSAGWTWAQNVIFIKFFSFGKGIFKWIFCFLFSHTKKAAYPLGSPRVENVYLKYCGMGFFFFLVGIRVPVGWRASWCFSMQIFFKHLFSWFNRKHPSDICYSNIIASL